MGEDERSSGEPRVVIAGGGTGGHLVPALALAAELRRRGAWVLVAAGTRGVDREILAGAAIPHRLLAAPALERRRWWRNALLPVALGRAIARGRRLLDETRPDVVVGTGGYVSVPVVLAAALGKRPILLQEQNRAPGIATRFLSRWADRICVQFVETAEALAGRAPIEVTGSPISPPEAEPADFSDRLDPDLPTVGAFGGSQGARAINDGLLGLLADDPAAAPYNLVWQTGRGDAERVEGAARWPDRFVVRPFFHRMAAVYPLLDVVVCRAGATTIAEVTAWGIPSILVPYPFATSDHQTANARAVEAAGAGIVVAEDGLTPRRLANVLEGLLTDARRRERMAAAARSLGRPAAASIVADRVLALAEAA